ncbi:hypothetical protein E4U21_007258 [Claviceps maximensis]|nr:hypothetical protein E4U21_007258 [Claviceps maximensis]
MSFYRSNGNSRCPWRVSTATVPQSSPALPSAPLGEVRHAILAADLCTADFDQDQVCITDCETVSSYNWLERTEASILVPGMPARWTPLPEPIQLKEDDGTYYRDRNAAGSPKYPLEPAIRSILNTETDAGQTKSIGTIDLFGCGNTFGNLLRFITGKAPSFRMLVEVVGSTVHLIRRERSPLETIPNVRGYGHSFPSAYTTWDSEVRGSSSHQRIVRYQLGGLGLLFLFEGDGYLPMETRSNLSNVYKKRTEEVSKASADDLLLSALSVSSQAPTSRDADALDGGSGSGSGELELKVSAAGHLMPRDCIFELKTRSIKRRHEQEFLIEPQLPRLWLRQIPTLILAYHNSGTFTDIRVMDVRNQVREWEKREALLIKKFISLLRQILEAARGGQAQGHRLEITHEEGADSICIREQEPGLRRLLPHATLERWESWLGKSSSSHSQSHPDDSSSALYDWGDDEPGEPDEPGDDFVWCVNSAACDDDCGYCGTCKADDD